MPSVEGLAARKAALAMLDAVLRQGKTLDSVAAVGRGLPGPDHALAVAIAGETLRRIPDLDTLIDGVTRQRLPDDSKARMVLRLALAQNVGLGTPDHAVVATALPLVDGGPRRLVHGVLGTLLRRGLPAMDAPHLPDAVEARWSQAWGEDVVQAARRQVAARPMLDLSFADAREADDYAAAQGARSFAPGHVRIDSSSVADLPGFGEGRWWVQDLAASLPARLVPRDQRAVLDLCAAPGGKTMQLAARGHDVTALDRAESRLERLRANLARTHLEARLVAADVLDWSPPAPVGAILLDAPCSATGTFRRHPEILYRARAAIIESSARLQSELLDRATSWLQLGGTLVYAVCSLEPEEGEQRITDFLAHNTAFRIDPPAAGELPDFVPVASEGWVRILPGLVEDQGGLDGFFMARLVRTA